MFETHTIAPILAYVPSIYQGVTWVRASMAVLDAASLLMASLDPKQTDAARICREVGVTAVRVLATELHWDEPVDDPAHSRANAGVDANFDILHDKLVELGLSVKANRDECSTTFLALRAEYEEAIYYIAKSTLMPVDGMARSHSQAASVH